MNCSYICSKVDEIREEIIELSDKMWACPEGAYQEYHAAEWCAEILKKYGFDVEVGAGGIPTAVVARFGSGHPVIGFLGEYDALPGLSQQKGVPKETPIPGQSHGHGCGHNLLGAANVAAVIALKAQMELEKTPGTIVFYGCPAEEIITGKPLMARAGLFDELDAALAFHPMESNMTTYGNMVALDMVKFHFKGISAHAGADPYNGRSALDAVELMNVGANYLREHVKPEQKLHYVITDGGRVPNIIPDKASVWYFLRAAEREELDSVYQRLVNVAKGAALMTGTEVEIEFLGGCYNGLNNCVLEDVVHQAMLDIPQEPWTEEELAFATELNRLYPGNKTSRQTAYNLPEEMEIHSGVLPMLTYGDGGSSDIGDVAHIVPTAFFTTACYNIGAPEHHWQVSLCAGHSIGHKGMLYGAKILAQSAWELLCDTTLLERANEEFQKAMKGKTYHCPLPETYQIPNS